MRDDEREGVPRGGPHSAEEIGRGEAPVAEARRALAAQPPAMPGTPLLPDASFVLEPQLDLGIGMGGTGCLYSRDEPLFANASAALASRWGWTRRAF